MKTKMVKTERVIRKKPLSAKETAEVRKLRKQVERDSYPDPSIGISAEQYFARVRLIAKLREEREKQHKSLADMSALTGMDKAALSRIETGRKVTYKLDTIERYADALGKLISFELLDKQKVSPKTLSDKPVAKSKPITRGKRTEVKR